VVVEDGVCHMIDRHLCRKFGDVHAEGMIKHEIGKLDLRELVGKAAL